MLVRRLVTACLAAVISAMALSVSALAQYTTDGAVSTLPNTGAGDGGSRVATELSTVALTVFALIAVAIVVGSIARRYRASAAR